MKNNVFIKLSNGIKMPFKKHIDDAGYDVYSPINLVVKAKSISERINLGISVEPEDNKSYLITAERSSQGMKGISTLGNIIDSNYRGKIHVTLQNMGNEDYIIEKGDRICQILSPKHGVYTFTQVDELSSTERGAGSHGSTGK